MMARVMPQGGIPGGMALDTEHMEMMAKLQSSMANPLSPVETLAVIDEMTELGVLPRATSAELKECMLVLPQSAQAMGMAMGMMKPMLPQMRDARERMNALSPEEQDELAQSIAQQLDGVPADERKAMLGELGGGMFPPRVVETLSRRYGVK